jgi:hypothetical protein
MYVERKIKLWACNTADACLTKSANCSVVLHLSEQKTMIRTASVENAMLLVLLTSHFLSDSPQHSLQSVRVSMSMWYFKTVICNKLKSREAALSKRTGPSVVRATLDPIQAVGKATLGLSLHRAGPLAGPSSLVHEGQGGPGNHNHQDHRIILGRHLY